MPSTSRLKNPDFHIVRGTTIRDIFNQFPTLALDVVRDTYLQHHRGRTENPDSYFLRFQDRPADRIIALPAASLDGLDKIAGLKWIASFPGNTRHNLQRASATLLLNDLETGYPVALLEASIISAVRTAASAVLSTFYLLGRRTEIPRLSFVGAGVISRTILEQFSTHQWSIGEVLIHDTDPDSAAAFKAHAQALGLDCTLVKHLEHALEANVVVLATNASQPYIDEQYSLKAGTVLLNVSLRDLAPGHILEAFNVTDDTEHCLKANTSLHVTEQQVGHRDFIHCTLAQLMLGECTPDQRRPLIFSPFGLGVLDVALGKKILNIALAQHQAMPVDDFFESTVRWS
ncbi:2,3-diaminopropionate biosynthesis protein SbnB [Pseudomonas sp. S2.OTC.A_B10]|uniref:2,3-diaminopropionate biosynthesis protein SbnB n=1 Tax=Pseudomonas sp. S2.OTC.A_B10 TaxID=3237018 RepID=UPI003CFABBF5